MSQEHVVAAIDVGSSATRLVVARLGGPVGPVTLHRQRAPVRLGTEVFATGEIGQASITQLVNAFIDFAQKLQQHRVVAYRAVATSALREAKNGAEVILSIGERSGIDVQLITGDHEAALMRQALLGALPRHGHPVPPPSSLLMDLGGGSLELMRADGSEVRSLPMGTVRLLGQHPQLLHPMTAFDVITLSERFVAQLRAQVGIVAPAPLGLGTGGNIEAMAQWMPSAQSVRPPKLCVESLLPTACALGPRPLHVRAKSFGLHHGRADLLLPAVLIVHAVCTVFCLQDILVPGAGIRDALLAELGQELTQA